MKIAGKGGGKVAECFSENIPEIALSLGEYRRESGEKAKTPSMRKVLYPKKPVCAQSSYEKSPMDYTFSYDYSP